MAAEKRRKKSTKKTAAKKAKSAKKSVRGNWLGRGQSEEEVEEKVCRKKISHQNIGGGKENDKRKIRTSTDEAFFNKKTAPQ